VTTRRMVTGYVVALVAVGVAVGVRIALHPLVDDRVPFITLFAAVAFATWYSGRGPGAFALLTGAASAAFFIIPPRYSFIIELLEHQVSLALFCLLSAVLIAIVNSLRNARQRAEAQQWELEKEIERRHAAEQSLAGREQLLRVTLSSIGDAVITTDANANVTSLNPIAEALTGWSALDAVGQPLEAIFKIVNETGRQTVENPAIRALKEGTVIGLTNHTILISKNGAERLIDDSAAPIRDHDGTILGAVLVFRDVTQRRQSELMLRQSEQRFAQFMQHLPGLAWIKDAQGRYIYVNDAA
jgi:PAS domain S-box-containing protein